MRTARKSDLAKAMVKNNSLMSKENGKAVLVDLAIDVAFDGGALLNRVKWPRKSKISEVLLSYEAYIINLIGHKSGKVTVVFDGYLEKSTKDHAHMQRYPVNSMEMVISIEVELQCDKDIFLSNPVNKQNFIDLLSKNLLKKGIAVTQCKKDADVSIIKCAMEKAMKNSVMVIWRRHRSSCSGSSLHRRTEAST